MCCSIVCSCCCDVPYLTVQVDTRRAERKKERQAQNVTQRKNKEEVIEYTVV